MEWEVSGTERKWGRGEDKWDPGREYLLNNNILSRPDLPSWVKCRLVPAKLLMQIRGETLWSGMLTGQYRNEILLSF